MRKVFEGGPKLVLRRKQKRAIPRREVRGKKKNLGKEARSTSISKKKTKKSMEGDESKKPQKGSCKHQGNSSNRWERKANQLNPNKGI